MAGNDERPDRVCFDTNAWSAIFNRETDKDLESLAEWLHRAEAKKCRIILPTVTIGEIHASSNRRAVAEFDSIIQGDAFEVVDFTQTLAVRTGALRRASIEANAADQSVKKLKMPDAMIIVSADAAGCDYLLSHDQGVQGLNGRLDIRTKIGPYRTGLPDDDRPLFDLVDGESG